MADAAIAVDRLKALEVALDFPAQIAFNHEVIGADGLDDLVDLLNRKVLRANVAIDVGLFEDLLGPGRPDAINIRQRGFDAFVAGDFNSE